MLRGYNGVNERSYRYEIRFVDSKRWYAYINYQKKRYYLGYFDNIDDAVQARKEGEAKMHDPVIIEYFNNLTPDKKIEFSEYLKNVGKVIDINGIYDLD